jgi:hypothetical protein
MDKSDLFVSKNGILMTEITVEYNIDYLIIEGVCEHHSVDEPFFFGHG